MYAKQASRQATTVSIAFIRLSNTDFAAIRTASRTRSQLAREMDRTLPSAASLPLTCSDSLERIASREFPAIKPSSMIGG